MYLYERNPKGYYCDFALDQIVRPATADDKHLRVGSKELFQHPMNTLKKVFIEVVGITTTNIYFEWDRKKISLDDMFSSKTYQGLIAETLKEVRDIFMNTPHNRDMYDPEETTYKRHFIKSDPKDMEVRVEDLNLKPETIKELERYKILYIGELYILGATHEYLDGMDAYTKISHRNAWNELMWSLSTSKETFYLRGRSLKGKIPISPISNLELPEEIIKELQPQTVDVALGRIIFDKVIPNTIIEETIARRGKTIMRLLPESYENIDQALKLRAKNEK